MYITHSGNGWGTQFEGAPVVSFILDEKVAVVARSATIPREGRLDLCPNMLPK